MTRGPTTVLEFYHRSVIGPLPPGPYMIRYLQIREFLRGIQFENHQAIVLSESSGLLHFETKTTCPAKIPGASEILLPEDYDTLNQFLLDSKMNDQVITVVVDEMAQAVTHPLFNRSLS